MEWTVLSIRVSFRSSKYYSLTRFLLFVVKREMKIKTNITLLQQLCLRFNKFILVSCLRIISQDTNQSFFTRPTHVF